MPIRNPIIPGFYPDPSVCRVDDASAGATTYYLVTSSFEYFPGIPIFRSANLVNWEQVGHVLDRPEQLELSRARSSGGVWAPTIRHNEGVFYVVYTLSGAGNFLVTSADPGGPWSDPVEIGTRPEQSDALLEGTGNSGEPCGEGGSFPETPQAADERPQPGIDPSLFFDDNGACYLTTGGNALSIIDLVTGRRLTDIRTIWENATGGGYLEAPHLYRIGDYYYLLVAEGGTGRGHMVSIARSHDPWGPYEPCPHNPILSNRGESGNPVQATGHGDLVQAHDGSWWMVFLAIREKPGAFPRVHNLGRETFLASVTWENDWPVVNGTGHVGLIGDADPPAPARPDDSEVHIRDDFDTPALPPHYNFRRNPLPGSWSLSERAGWLTLHGVEAGLDDPVPQAFIGRRQQHDEFSVRTLLRLTGATDEAAAGLTAIANERHHYDVFVTVSDGQRRVLVRHRIGHMAQEIASMSVSAGDIVLEIRGDIESYHFTCEIDGVRHELASGGARYLSTEVASGFTGVYLGMFCTGVGDLVAQFDWFEYIGRA